MITKKKEQINITQKEPIQKKDIMVLLTQLELKSARSTVDELCGYELDGDLNKLTEVNQELAKMTARDIYFPFKPPIQFPSSSRGGGGITEGKGQE